MKPVGFFFSPHCPPTSLPASVSPQFLFSLSPPSMKSANVMGHDSHSITDLCSLADIQRDIPADRDTHSLSLMMDQKASLLISGIGRREGAGHMLEPSVLHLWNGWSQIVGDRDRGNQTPFNGCYMPKKKTPVHHRTPWHSGARWAVSMPGQLHPLFLLPGMLFL